GSRSPVLKRFRSNVRSFALPTETFPRLRTRRSLSRFRNQARGGPCHLGNRRQRGTLRQLQLDFVGKPTNNRQRSRSAATARRSQGSGDEGCIRQTRHRLPLHHRVPCVVL